MKHSFLPIIIAMLGIFASGALANPPDSLRMNLDSTGLLTVQVFHLVKDPAKHYITKVVVELNGKTIIQQSLSSQTDNKVQELIYKIIDAKVKDKIAVTANCNITGKKKDILTVGEKSKTEEQK